MFHQPLCLKDLFFPIPPNLPEKWHDIGVNVVILCLQTVWKDNILPPEQIPPNRTEHKCSYSCAATPHSSRKSFHQGCAVFLSHFSKDCCNSDANARRRPHFTHGAPDPLLPITTRLMQIKKWTKIKAGFLPCEKTEEFPLYYEVIKIWRDALYFLAVVTNSTKHEKQGFPKY